jgi:hypothetical protein
MRGVILPFYIHLHCTVLIEQVDASISVYLLHIVYNRIINSKRTLSKYSHRPGLHLLRAAVGPQTAVFPLLICHISIFISLHLTSLLLISLSFVFALQPYWSNGILYYRYLSAIRYPFGGTMIQAGRSRVLFPMRSFDFSTDLILPAALWFWGQLCL